MAPFVGFCLDRCSTPFVGPSVGKSCRVPASLLRNEYEDSATFDLKYRPFRPSFTEGYNGCNSYVIGSQPRPSWEVEYGGKEGVGLQNATPPPRQCFVVSGVEVERLYLFAVMVLLSKSGHRSHAPKEGVKRRGNWITGF
jgi:hypothetical protein